MGERLCAKHLAGGRIDPVRLVDSAWQIQQKIFDVTSARYNIRALASRFIPARIGRLRCISCGLSAQRCQPRSILMADKGPAALLWPTAALLASVLEASSRRFRQTTPSLAGILRRRTIYSTLCRDRARFGYAQRRLLSKLGLHSAASLPIGHERPGRTYFPQRWSESLCGVANLPNRVGPGAKSRRPAA
jgi:hypothetical protein